MKTLIQLLKKHGVHFYENDEPSIERAEAEFLSQSITPKEEPYELRLETRPCSDCKNYKVLPDGKICTKKLMAVTADMFVTYYADEGTCFEAKEEPRKEEEHRYKWQDKLDALKERIANLPDSEPTENQSAVTNPKFYNTENKEEEIRAMIDQPNPDWLKIALGANRIIDELKQRIKDLEKEKGKEESSWISGYRETLKAALQNAIENQEQGVPSVAEFNNGIEEGIKYALEMLDKHLHTP